jgi:hypothetical protein
VGLRCTPTRVGQPRQELLAALLRIDVLARGRDAARAQERLDSILHPHHVLHDPGVRAAELAQCPVVAHLLEHPLLERSRPQLFCQLESILLVALLVSCSTSACPFVSTTCSPSRLPVPLTTAKVVLAACTSRPNYLSMGVLLRRYRCSQPEGFSRARRAPTIQQGGRLGGALPLRGVGPWAPVDGLHPQHRRDGHGSPRTHGATARAEALLLPPRPPPRAAWLNAETARPA